ncbi:hypothetical protein DLM45_09835 [Hyphomicrobium methylovorum]|uniref:hypothetical protein n=1 Tax=Hyphomicrobium methylovorum TaxID=84 RepID=UPI0015E71D0A|nr:hypothetical protein [Hyphomicrobium methylovorum]MBA2126519.1 hypothetical protein [Hyphomicrobium methylovorum]
MNGERQTVDEGAIVDFKFDPAAKNGSAVDGANDRPDYKNSEASKDDPGIKRHIDPITKALV